MIEKKKQIFTSLTGMRGIACMCIMCYHYFACTWTTRGWERKHCPSILIPSSFLCMAVFGKKADAEQAFSGETK